MGSYAYSGDMSILEDKNLFYQLTPDFVLNAVEASGWRTTGQYLQLNSYENRVFDIKTEAQERVIAKFYRPARWSEAAILEEHQFLQQLRDTEVPAIAPLVQNNNETLSIHSGLKLALFPKARGRMPQEFRLEDLSKLGRVVARMHNVGAQKPAPNRPKLTPEIFGYINLNLLEPMITPMLRERYLSAAEEILEFLEEALEPNSFQRIHGDCHRGNVLMTDEPGKPNEFFLIDFDDFVIGPPVQDFWMLFRHDEDDVHEEIDAFLEGYTELREFDEGDLSLMTPLRGLRIIHYAAWIARRWEDPSFSHLFPQFNSEAYWLEEAQALESVAQQLP